MSLDLELHWGIRDRVTVGASAALFDGVHTVVPQLLRAFNESEIHATWAAVGLLFFESKQELLGSLPISRPKYDRRELSPYLCVDELGEDWRCDQCHFAPELIAAIARSPQQEVATHTFSHYYCLEDGQTVEDFRADLQAAANAAVRHKIKLKSIVFPRNQYSSAHLKVCQEVGIIAYRGNPASWFWSPSATRGESLAKRGIRLLDAHLPLSGHTCSTPASPPCGEPVNIAASSLLRPVGRSITFLDKLRLRRIKRAMLCAARQHSVYHLWWHPENFAAHPARNLEYLEEILDWYGRVRSAEGMRSMGMAELADEVLAGQLGGAA